MASNSVRIASSSLDMISDPRWIPGVSWLQLLRANFGSGARKANDYDRFSTLDGAGGCHQ